MDVVTEHSLLPDTFSPLQWDNDIKSGFCLNPNANDFQKKYFYIWNTQGTPGYYTTYIIGAQNINGKQLVVAPKKGCLNIDFLKMFYVCFFNSEYNSSAFNQIYNIDFNKPKIKTNTFSSVLTPLIVVNYLSTIKEVVSKGLKRDYVYNNKNLKKVKGKVCILKNDRLNIRNKRCNMVYCDYHEYSLNTVENRLLKRALIFSLKILHLMNDQQNAVALIHKANIFLQSFIDVDDNIDICEIKNIKRNKLYKEYTNAIELAKILLQKFDYSLSKVGINEKEVPSFWIDMSLLYEHYIFGLLKKAYGKRILYQFKGNTGYPDFLYKSNNKDEESAILDTKYIPRLKNQSIDVDIIRQLSGYARDSKIREELSVKNYEMIPCFIIYPSDEILDNPFNDSSIFDSAYIEIENGISKFYKIGVPLPRIKI